MFWLSVCLLITSREWFLEGKIFPNLGTWSQSSVSLDSRAESLVLAGLDNHFWILSPDGNVRKIDTGDLNVYRIASGDGTVFFYGLRDGKQNILATYDLVDGTLTNERVISSTPINLQTLGSRLAVTNSVRGMSPMITIYDGQTLEPEDSFFKPTEALRLDRNFSSLWVVERGNVFAIMSQLSPNVYFATPARIQQERDGSDRIPNSLPYLELALGDSYRLPREVSVYSSGGGLRNNTKGVIEQFHDWFASSRILYFGSLGVNHVVCYEIPDLIDGMHVGNHLGIQMFDKDFEPLGPVRERFGQVAGVANERLHIIYPNGTEPIPGEPGALAAHYGFDTIENQAQLLKSLKRYRVPEDGIHHILVETFVPDSVSVVE